VRFLARGPGYAVFLTPTQAILRLHQPPTSGADRLPQFTGGAVLAISLVGGNTAPQLLSLDPTAGLSNYLIGNDPVQWHTNIPNFGRVAYRQVYPGIDLIYYGNQRQLEDDFVVPPGAHPGTITPSFQGAQTPTPYATGNLVIHTAAGDPVEHAPVLYQEGSGGRQAVAGRYVLLAPDRVGFRVDAYDRSRPLVIDPTLAYSTYLGGSSYDFGYGIAVDAAGNAYVTGTACRINFPTPPGALQTTHISDGTGDAFVAKLNVAGTALVYSTYLGGSGYDSGAAIAVDAAGNAFVTGSTSSSNFPTTAGAFQTKYGGGFLGDALVAKLNAARSAFGYSTDLGGSGCDASPAIAVDAAGNAYLTGNTYSDDFPTTAGAFQTVNGGAENAFVTKLDAAGATLGYSTYLGGSNGFSNGIALDVAG